MDGSSGSMTLAFDLDAMRSLAAPDAVVDDARRWTEYVGIVADEPTPAVTSFARTHRIRQDFFSGPKDRQTSLANVRTQFETDRYVYVGQPEDESIAARSGWEFLTVEEAAEAADWELGDPEPPDNRTDTGREDWP
ncbi:MAG: DUF7124 domain-containing protein [Halococcoides sp.]